MKQGINGSKTFPGITSETLDKELSHYVLKEDFEKYKAEIQTNISNDLKDALHENMQKNQVNTRWLIGIVVTIIIGVITILFSK